MILPDAFLNRFDLFPGNVVLFLSFLLSDNDVSTGAMTLPFVACALRTRASGKPFEARAADQQPQRGCFAKQFLPSLLQ